MFYSLRSLFICDKYIFMPHKARAEAVWKYVSRIFAQIFYNEAFIVNTFPSRAKCAESPHYHRRHPNLQTIRHPQQSQIYSESWMLEMYIFSMRCGLPIRPKNDFIVFKLFAIADGSRASATGNEIVNIISRLAVD